MRPLLRFDCDDIGMRHQQKRGRRPISLEPGNEGAAISARSHYLAGDTLGLKEVVQVLGCAYLVAGRVARIQAEQVAYTRYRLFSNLLPVDGILTC